MMRIAFIFYLISCSIGSSISENHGLNHRPCSFNVESAYGIKGVEDTFDEIEANARKIEAITGHRPRFYRSATAFMDEACVSMAARRECYLCYLIR